MKYGWVILVLMLGCACATVQTGYYVFNQGVDDELFQNLVSDLTDQPMVGGNQVTILENGVQILPSMLEAIEQAKESIHLETYIFNGDQTGMRFAQALAEKAAAGVEVRVLFDHVGSNELEKWVPVIQEAGGRVFLFNRFRWNHMLKGNHRTHRKILVVDGQVGFTGGVGLSHEWEGNADSPDHWRDTHVRVTGPVVAHLQDLFAENWKRQTGEEIIGQTKYYPAAESSGDSWCGVVGAVKNKDNWADIREMWLLPLAAAQKYFYLNIAYFIPDQDTMKALEKAVERGVDVRFIVPGEENDLVAVRWVSMKYYGRLLDAGVRIYEYQGTNMHAKTGVCDDYWLTIGAANYDNRSFSYNYESNLVALDRNLAGQMKSMFLRDLEQSVEIDRDSWRKRPIYRKFLENVVGLIEGWM